MIRCPQCSTSIMLTQYTTACPVCHSSPQCIDGFMAFSPELSHSGGGFNPEHFPHLAKLENNNFWFKARNRLIINTLKKYHSGFDTCLEIGCGTGYVLSGLKEAFSRASFWGSEIFTEGLKFAAKRQPETRFIQMDARQIPFEEEFDLIGAFDVLEHIEEDTCVLHEIHKALKPEGTLILTVPQHPWLWSVTDEVACHERRYNYSDLRKKLKKTGFQTIYSTSFVTLLLPAMLLSRLKMKNNKKEHNPTSELQLPRLLNKVFHAFMLIELLLIKLGLRLPIGGSRLVVARKHDKAT
ncbi:class I SAM-dependent methyltransferase [Endozoicomonadaceae bacterium StTr2]